MSEDNQPGGQPPEADAPPATKVKTVKARVLMPCVHGQPNDVVELPADLAKQAEKDGAVDTDKAAVSYAASLPQNKRADPEA